MPKHNLKTKYGPGLGISLINSQPSKKNNFVTDPRTIGTEYHPDVEFGV